MHRFYLPPEECAGESLSLIGSEAHHAAHVLRLRPDDQVTVLNGAGGVFLCRVRDVSRRAVELNVLSHLEAAPANPSVTLFQALPKGKLIEDIIEKATELGVSRVVPLVTERVVARFDEGEALARQAKWQTVAVEAIKQCGQPWLPLVEKPQTLPTALSRPEKIQFQLAASLRPDSKHPRNYFSVFKEFKARLNAPLQVGVWIGPEGDFTPAELDAIQLNGAMPITLGNLVLRCETAAMFCLSIFNYELGPERAE